MDAATPPLTPTMCAAVESILEQAQEEANKRQRLPTSPELMPPPAFLPRTYVARILRELPAPSMKRKQPPQSTSIDVTAQRLTESKLCTQTSPPFWLRC